jgi:hypothetical protein
MGKRSQSLSRLRMVGFADVFDHEARGADPAAQRRKRVNELLRAGLP